MMRTFRHRGWSLMVQQRLLGIRPRWPTPRAPLSLVTTLLYRKHHYQGHRRQSPRTRRERLPSTMRVRVCLLDVPCWSDWCSRTDTDASSHGSTPTGGLGRLPPSDHRYATTSHQPPAGSDHPVRAHRGFRCQHSGIGDQPSAAVIC